MAKTYINTVKYNIMSKFEIEGIVDKHDIVGAVFGQCEGLLGEQMDLRELQQGGKIGRIEINPETTMGTTKGTLIVPSSMDMVQTSMLAAAIEAVDKVGPYTAKFSTEKIEDTRNEKRAEIKNRAEELLKKFMKEQMPQSQELAETIRENVRSSDITDYGPDKSPAGPEVDSANDIIVVEGRADVINLLKNQINNVVGMDGAKIPATIIELCNKKETTMFIDGDRGGVLNARRLSQVAKVDFIARAPDGKEVEELARKEIVMALRKKMPAGEFLAKESNGFDSPNEQGFPEKRSFGCERSRSYGSGKRTYRPRGSYGPRSSYGGRERPRGRGMGRPRYSERSYSPRGPRSFHSQSFQPRQQRESFGESNFEQEQQDFFISPAERQQFLPVMQQLQGTLKAKLFDAEMKEIAESDVRNVVEKIAEMPNVSSVVFDGIITKRLVEEAAKKGVKTIVGIKKGKIDAVEGAPKTIVISTQ